MNCKNRPSFRRQFSLLNRVHKSREINICGILEKRLILEFNTFINLLSIQVWFQLPSAINAVILIITVIINGSPLLRPIGKPPSFSVTRLEAARSPLLTTSPTSQPRQPVDKSFHNFPQNKHNYHNNHLLYMLHNRTYRHHLLITLVIVHF